MKDLREIEFLLSEPLAGRRDFIPYEKAREELPAWKAWEQCQENGAWSYREKPEANLSQPDRRDVTAFRRFADLAGHVLDVGCGPGQRPGYVGAEVDLVGIDPLEPADPDFFYLKAICEYLPFKDGGFDAVVFGTSYDHVLDPEWSLRECRRVLKPGGRLLLWEGQHTKPRKEFDLPVPEGAEDPFHIKKYSVPEILDQFERNGIRVVAHADVRFTERADYVHHFVEAEVPA